MPYGTMPQMPRTFGTGGGAMDFLSGGTGGGMFLREHPDFGGFLGYVNQTRRGDLDRAWNENTRRYDQGFAEQSKLSENKQDIEVMQIVASILAGLGIDPSSMGSYSPQIG